MKNKKILSRNFIINFFSLLIVLATFFLNPDIVKATPTSIGYDGYVTNTASIPQTGNHNIRIRVYDALIGGSLLYDESHANSPISNGYFSVSMGSGAFNGGLYSSFASIPFDAQYFVSLEISTLSTGEMGPRTPINAVAYAHTAYGVIAQSTVPATTTKKAGEMYFNTTSNTLFVYNALSQNWSALGGGSGVTSMNGQSGSSQTFAIGNAGVDFSISSTGNVHTFNIPNASAIARGLISTTTQSFVGDKSFTGNTTFATTTATSFTAGSLSGTVLNITATSTTAELIATANAAIGGNLTVSGTTALANLILSTTPTIGSTTTDQVLVRDSSGNIKQISVSALNKLTSISASSPSSFTYIDENGSSTVINIKSLETLTRILNNVTASGTLSYIDESGATTTINIATLPSLTVTGVSTLATTTTSTLTANMLNSTTLNITATTTLSGVTTLGNTLTVAGNTILSQALGVAGTSTLATTTVTALAVSGSTALGNLTFNNATGTVITVTTLNSGKANLTDILTLASTTPSTTTNALYNIGGNLYFNGSQLGVAGAGNEWKTINGTLVRVATSTNQVLIGGTATTTDAQLEVQGKFAVAGIATLATTTATRLTVNTLTATTSTILGNETIAGLLGVIGTSTLATTTASALSAATLSIIGQTSLANASSSALTVSGTTNLGLLSVSGVSSLATTTATRLSVTGDTVLSSLLSVVGTSTLATTTITALTVNSILVPNLNLAGILTVGGTTTLATTTATALNANRLLIGTSTLDPAFADGQTLIGLVGNINNYIEANIKNLSTGNNAQSGFTATANTGTATSGFMYTGINNSGFNLVSASNVGSAGDTNVLGLGNDMYIANGSTNKNLLLLAGGTGTSTSQFVRLAINGTTGLVLINNAFATKKGTDYTTTGSTNNVSFGNTSLVRLTGGSAQTITGIAGGSDGQILTIINAGSSTSALTNADLLSAAANRITTGTGAALALAPNASVQLIYDSGTSIWRVVGGSGGSAGGFSSIDIANLASGGTIGTAAATVDTATNFNVNQTTALQVLTLPSPTSPVTTKGKIITINNVGSANFTIGGITVSAGSYGSAFVWNGTIWNPINAASNVAAEFGENNGITNSQSSAGTAIADIVGSSFTLPSAGTWEINYNIHYSNSAGGGNRPTFYISDNSNNVVAYGNSGPFQPTASFVNEASGIVRVTTTGSAVYKMRWSNDGASWTIINTTGATQGNYASKVSWKKISGNTAVTGQSVDYMYGYNTLTYFTDVATGDHIKFDNVRSSGGTISLDTATAYTSTANAASVGRITLKAGKTYKLAGTINNADIATYGAVQWFNADTNAALGLVSSQSSPDSSSNRAISGWAVAYFTPTVDTRVELRIVFESLVSVNGSGDSIGPAQFTVDQIGSSAFTAGTGLNFDSLRAAVASNFLDNTNFDQTWLWTTLTNTPALTLNAGALTTGSLLNLSSASTAITTGSLFNATLTGTPTAFTGNVANISIPLASNAGNTGTLLNINDSGAANLTKLLALNSNSTTNTNALMSLTSASAGAFANGGALFNFTGAHTNSAVKINTATLLGTALEINPSALTTGTGINLFTSSASLNPTVGLLRVANTGASTLGKIFNIGSNGAEANALNIFANGSASFGSTGVTSWTGANNTGKLQLFNGSNPAILFQITTDGQTSSDGGFISRNSSGMFFAELEAGKNLDIYNVSAGVRLSQGGTSWTAISDSRLKSNISELSINDNASSSVLSKITELDTVTYDLYNGNHEIGVIAQNLKESFPDLVLSPKDINAECSASNQEGCYRVNYDRLGVVALAGIKELNMKIFGKLNIEGKKLSSLVNTLDDINLKLDTGSMKVSNTDIENWIKDESIVTYLDAIKAESNRDVVKHFTDKMKNGYHFITDFTSERITAYRGYFNQLFAKEATFEDKICLGKEPHVTCVTKDQLDRMLQGNGIAPNVSNTSGNNTQTNITDNTSNGTTTSDQNPPLTTPIPTLIPDSTINEIIPPAPINVPIVIETPTETITP